MHVTGSMVLFFSLIMICSVQEAAGRMKNKMQKNNFTLVSSAFKHGDMIPKQYTCDGKNISPDLSWSNAPENTKSFALIVDDPDAPAKIWVHWIVYNIPVSLTSIPSDADTSNFALGITDFGNTQYGGPCPPSGTHKYRFTLYALDTTLPKEGSVTKAALLGLMEGHIVAQTTLMGTYRKIAS
jgi:Raf kinase inhibitor-like YbhB/YbcL family protein